MGICYHKHTEISSKYFIFQFLLNILHTSEFFHILWYVNSYFSFRIIFRIPLVHRSCTKKKMLEYGVEQAWNSSQIANLMRAIFLVYGKNCLTTFLMMLPLLICFFISFCLSVFLVFPYSCFFMILELLIHMYAREK